MEITEIIGLISQYGFPAVVAIYALYQGYKQQERHEQRVDELTKTHKEETKATTDAITELKVAITELTGFLKGEGR